MSSRVVKAPERAAARCISRGDQAPPVTLPANKCLACFVHIYHPDRNTDLDFLQSFKLTPNGSLGWVGFLLFHSCTSEDIHGSDPNWPFSWKNEYDLSTELMSIGQKSSKVCFSCKWVRIFWKFSAWMFVLFMDHSRGKNGKLQKYFWSWIRNGEDVPEITSISLTVSGAGTLCLGTCCWVFEQEL